MRSPAVIVAAVLAAAAFYLLLIDTTLLAELCGLAAVALLAGAAYATAREGGTADATAALRCLRRGWVPFLRIPGQTALLIREAFAQLLRPRRSRGTLTTIAYHPDQDREDTGREALAQYMGSVAPNTIVIGIDPEGERMVAHQLVPSENREELDVLGLG